MSPVVSALDSRSDGRGFEPSLRCRVLSLDKKLNPHCVSSVSPPRCINGYR